MKRDALSLLALISLGGLTAPTARAGADDRPPDALVRWGNAIKAAYPHYAKVSGG